MGLGEFYTTDGHGNVKQLGRSDSGWLDSWTQIVAGNFGATTPKDFTDLLFYDADKGLGEFYTTDGQGNLTRLGGTIRLLKSSQIVAGNFGPTRDGATPPKDFTDLLFYKRP